PRLDRTRRGPLPRVDLPQRLKGRRPRRLGPRLPTHHQGHGLPDRALKAKLLPPEMTAAEADERGAAVPELDSATAEEIALEAYVYLYPLVLMERTRLQMTNVRAGGERLGRAPVDAFAHFREYPGADFKDVVKPNFDTLYSPAWLDLRAEPRIVSVPATDLYYLLPMYDMWTDIFASPGTRTNGGVAGEYALSGPGWEGALPNRATPP